MVCQAAHWSNFNVCRMPVLGWYLLRVDCRITSLLINLHWLPIHSRIVIKILLLTFKILHGTALTYLESLISLKPQSCYNLRRSSDTLLLKVARYSFSGPIPTKFEHKLRRHKQSFGKIATTVVLDEDKNLLWSGLQWHRSCHSNEMTLLPILLAAVYLGTGNCSSKIIHGSFFLQ